MTRCSGPISTSVNYLNEILLLFPNSDMPLNLDKMYYIAFVTTGKSWERQRVSPKYDMTINSYVTILAPWTLFNGGCRRRACQTMIIINSVCYDIKPPIEIYVH